MTNLPDKITEEDIEEKSFGFGFCREYPRGYSVARGMIGEEEYQVILPDVEGISREKVIDIHLMTFNRKLEELKNDPSTD